MAFDDDCNCPICLACAQLRQEARKAQGATQEQTTPVKRVNRIDFTVRLAADFPRDVSIRDTLSVVFDHLARMHDRDTGPDMGAPNGQWGSDGVLISWRAGHEGDFDATSAQEGDAAKTKDPRADRDQFAQDDPRLRDLYDRVESRLERQKQERAEDEARAKSGAGIEELFRRFRGGLGGAGTRYDPAMSLDDVLSGLSALSGLSSLSGKKPIRSLDQIIRDAIRNGGDTPVTIEEARAAGLIR